MTAPRVVGLDLSLTSTGACWRVSPSAAPTAESWPMKAAQGGWRLVEIMRLARGLCEDADLVVISEGDSRLHEAIHWMLDDLGIRYVHAQTKAGNRRYPRSRRLWVHGMAMLGEKVST